MNDFAAFHDELRDVARSMLATHAPRLHEGSAGPAVEPATLAEMGWTGLEVAEANGGVGAGLAESAVVAAELGRVAAPSSFLSSGILAAGALGRLGDHPTVERLLAAIASGTETVVLAIDATTATVEPTFSVSSPADGERLDGVCEFALDVADADVLVVPARRSDALVFCVLDPTAPGVTIEATPVVDESRSVGRVTLVDVAVGPTDVLASHDARSDLAALAGRAAVAVAADSLAVAEAVLEATTEHVGARHQFNRPLGSFQAVKHGCADTLTEITLARALLSIALADSVEPASAAFARSASMAKAAAGDAAVAAAGRAVQYHGGIGYSWETGLHVFQKRALLDQTLFGSSSAHRAAIADAYRPASEQR